MGGYNDPQATVHMVVGNGGNTEGHQSYKGKPRPSWHAVDNDVDYGGECIYCAAAVLSQRDHWRSPRTACLSCHAAGILTIPNASTLKWQFLRATDGTVADAFTITKSS